MKLPRHVPQIYLKPPALRVAKLLCETDQTFQEHDYDGKDAIWADNGRLVVLQVRFKCRDCAHVRYFGNENVVGYHKQTEYEASEDAWEERRAEVFGVDDDTP